ncbi:zinc finger C2HC domain-containing protein 1A-like [Hemiscyllium ocellatum]|uniref:zinc finger C2HC domain-containing protein 1A-like n=1 Tax=Hemiscyllium ocellatum TaxID=170820 RepID=UPI0029661E37|nr:zinc finger C2HC domain-containing protein 1A-like [Hemiscyllium ocellatum]
MWNALLDKVMETGSTETFQRELHCHLKRKTVQDYGDQAGNEQNLNLVPCRNCGRKFEQANLERHEPICSKVTNKKKKVFNSYKQRVAGTEVSSVRGLSAAKMPQPVSHWKQQHEDFINTIRSARLATDAVKKGLPLPPPPPASINPDYIECPYCNRRFNETAAERHISFCKTNVNRKVVARHDPTPSSFHPQAPPPPAQVQLASKQPTRPMRAPAIPSTSYQAPRGPPVQPVPPIRTAQAVHSRPVTLPAPSAVGSPSRGKLSSAAQAVMGVRADYNDPSTSRPSANMRGPPEARGPPTTQQ